MLVTPFFCFERKHMCADPHRELQVNKHKYCMAKDDIVIGLGRAMYSVSINTTKRKAYPAVIVTLGGMNKYARKWLAIHNFACQVSPFFTRRLHDPCISFFTHTYDA